MTSTAQKPKKRRMKFSPSVNFIGIIMLILAALSLSIVVILTIKQQNLTPLENLMFTIIIFIFSTVGSVIISAYFNQDQARKEYEQLARPSLRRVTSLQSATLMIEQRVAERADDVKSTADGPTSELTWLEGLRSNLQMLLHQIGDANSDWRELLPKEYEDALRERSAEVAEKEAQIREYVQQIESLQGKIEEQGKRAKEGDGKAAETIKDLEQQLSKLQRNSPITGNRSYNYMTSSSNLFNVKPTSIITDDTGFIIGGKYDFNGSPSGIIGSGPRPGETSKPKNNVEGNDENSHRKS
ncbi:hypothetical protein LVY72_12350 [Arthrobacter sp. I2-34]|uniref:Uncharacterized protein n=1 Tax=Arthrobacter hankyongi TaxID=2904801 RepID=A0ABS9L894_9MICC|nr:hypothetical protein [Arthrobacter hankyongi]MCG2622694.1 hypothetical protein [Arthrobacter hankyongi]